MGWGKQQLKKFPIHVIHNGINIETFTDKMVLIHSTRYSSITAAGGRRRSAANASGRRYVEIRGRGSTETCEMCEARTELFEVDWRRVEDSACCWCAKPRRGASVVRGRAGLFVFVRSTDDEHTDSVNTTNSVLPPCDFLALHPLLIR